MPVFPPLPLGQRIPASTHAVSCSLPTMRSVRGYEEKDPEVTRHMSSGYPRFVMHPFLHRLAGHLAQRHALGGYTLWLVSSAKMGDRLAAHLGAAHVVRVDDGVVHAVAHPDSAELGSRAKTFLQHIGGFLSSRAAEDRLVYHHLVSAVEQEKHFSGDALSEVRQQLAPCFSGVPSDHLWITNCGMSAVDAAFRAVSEVQAARGRTIWVQLGWLYLDTIALLKKFTATPSDYIYVRDVFDLPSLERLFAEKGSRIAGLIAEVPSNPLIQTPNLAALSELVHRHGASLVLDPSVTSVFNVNVLPYADVIVSSLTKYAASEGDLTAGLVVINPAGNDAAELQARVKPWIEPLYSRDLTRLAYEIGNTGEVLTTIHENAQQVAQFLSEHPAVKDVFWALHPASRENYLGIARTPGAIGGMITFSVRGKLDPFYDRLRLPKGPSFGMTTTLICPYIYLAHYDLVGTPAGRAELESSGLNPDLLRLCVGTEPVYEIIGALGEALNDV